MLWTRCICDHGLGCTQHVQHQWKPIQISREGWLRACVRACVYTRMSCRGLACDCRSEAQVSRAPLAAE